MRVKDREQQRGADSRQITCFRCDDHHLVLLNGLHNSVRVLENRKGLPPLSLFARKFLSLLVPFGVDFLTFGHLLLAPHANSCGQIGHRVECKGHAVTRTRSRAVSEGGRQVVVKKKSDNVNN